MAQVSAHGEAVGAARNDLEVGRRQIGDMHARGLDALQVCGRLTSLIDRVVLRLYDAALDECPPGKADALRSRLSLVGLGSYGRRQSAPFSDVDLMVLHRGAVDPPLAALVRRLTSSIFDARLSLGHSVRTPAEAVHLARQDAVICSSLIDSRLVAGDRGVFQEFRESFAKAVRRRARAAALALHEARSKERQQYGESLYLLEPHIKRSRGGLRDLHLVQWLGFVEHGESDPDRLHLIGAMSKYDYRRLLTAREHLLRLRNEMHFHAQAAKDGLDRAEQVRLAAWLGCAPRDGLLPVEHFMREYFRHTNHLAQMADRREAMLRAEPRTVSRLLAPVLSRNVTGDYRVSGRSITATAQGRAKLGGDPDEVLRLVDLAIKTGKLLDQATWSMLMLAAPECPEELSPQAAERFRHVLANAPLLGKTLSLLHQLGYLEKFVPAVRRARCLLQFNQYHKYTVDEHCLRAVQQAADFSPRDDALGEAVRQVANRRVLHLALLVHDLGKGGEEDHSVVGARIARETAQRLRLPAAEADDLEFLVRRHLAMSHLAFRRDLSDPRVVEQFAEQVGTAERLRMLFVLSCADLAAVGPGVLTRWKVEVLADLYRRTLALLEASPGREAERASAQTARVLDSLGPGQANDPWFRSRLAALPPTFLLALEPAEIARTLMAFRALAPRQATAWGRYNAEARTVEFVAGIETGVGRGAFSSMAGALTARGLQILSADNFVLPDELLVLHYVAIDPDSPAGAAADRLDEISQALAASVESAQPPKFRRVFGQERALAAVRLSQLPNLVRVDNDASDRATVVEVFTVDRSGLLYALARRLHDLELTIRHAKISTHIDQVVDVFYVTERDGRKIVDPQRIDGLQREMHLVIQAES